jgi:hypothetical protein
VIAASKKVRNRFSGFHGTKTAEAVSALLDPIAPG